MIYGIKGLMGGTFFCNEYKLSNNKPVKLLNQLTNKLINGLTE